MATISEINNFLQSHLNQSEEKSLSATEAAHLLDEAGLLKDSAHRPGLPLRRHLRAGKIMGAKQEPNKRWIIQATNDPKMYSVKEAAEELEISQQAVRQRIDSGKIEPFELGNKKLISEMELRKERIQRGLEEKPFSVEAKDSIKREIMAIRFEAENILNRIDSLEKLLK